ncbi:hypothetical protein H634G_10508 [Metarhizium anisopliae BRIP 53293]|uniref:Magnesium transporter n=1 Tax=Metarhizium anisopliae BRIP 53293 TaxID=1291518 RepID=A0A0D9NJB5_METAN|nr:hypothetical protein H634G_10508 [Metarhizium anisopliae BRIP 53293]
MNKDVYVSPLPSGLLFPTDDAFAKLYLPDPGDLFGRCHWYMPSRTLPMRNLTDELLGLMDARKNQGFNGDGFEYLRNPLWWLGICSLVLGEICNFAAYAFAPAILVTPLGALSVIFGAVMGSFLLNEQLGPVGRSGIAICLLGAVLVIIHAPPEQPVETIDQILDYALQPGFLLYALAVLGTVVFLIYKVAPVYGKKHALVYLSVCSLVGSISIMGIKALGMALKLTFSGNNQFTHPSTYAFLLLSAGCIIVQMNYFNKALASFPANIVNPLYYVTFTTATLSASLILYGGLSIKNVVTNLSLLLGLLVTFIGVIILNLSQRDAGIRNSVTRGSFERIPFQSLSNASSASLANNYYYSRYDDESRL